MSTISGPYWECLVGLLWVTGGGCGREGVFSAVVYVYILLTPNVSVDMTKGAAVITLGVCGVHIVFVGVCSKSDGYMHVGRGVAHID